MKLEQQMKNNSAHLSVMLDEVIEYLAPKEDEVILDATFGAGGYSRAILEAGSNVIALDRDENVRPFSDKLKQEYPGKFRFYQGKFGDMKYLAEENDFPKLNGVVFDVGVSSMQLDTKERGFSFMYNAALDMRMGKDGISAYDIVNNTEEEELANIIYNYGGERKSRHIARKICIKRKEKPIETTFELADIVRSVVRRTKIDPATRTFQAIRIAVNDELGELERALEDSLDLLAVGGRIVVVTFHSLEDTIVKKFFIDKSAKQINTSRYLPDVNNDKIKYIEILTRNTAKPTEMEVNLNPRARSAKLRAAKKIYEVAS